MDPVTVLGVVGQQDGHASADEYSGFDQSISQFCLALKTKLVKALDHPKNLLPIASIKSLEEELSITVALCRRAINHHDSAIHNLPPEVLAAAASHLDDKESLIAATHVCHRWRSIFLSFPRLWSHVEFSDERCALAFLERSKSIPISVYLPGGDEPSEVVKESLKPTVADRLIGLSGSYNRFLGEFLTQPLPLLRDLELSGSRNPPPLSLSVPALPSVRSLVTGNLDYPPRFPLKNLTDFCFRLSPSFDIPPAFGDTLLEFLRSCQLLEVVHLSCGLKDHDIEFTIGPSTEIVSLPCLRSFTHDSPFDKVDIALFDRLSVPPTCDLAFTIIVGSRTPRNRPWTCAFPTPRNRSYISDIKMVKVIVEFRDKYTPRPTFRTEFFNSKNARIAFTRVSDPQISSAFINLLDFLESSGITHSVEVLRLEGLHEGLPTDLTGRLLKFNNLKTLILWQCKLAPFLSNLPPPAVWCRTVQKLVVCPLPLIHPRGYRDEALVLRKVRNLAIERRKHRIPLGTVTMFSRDIEYLSRECQREIDEVRSHVGSMEVIRLGD